jgi:hypothetical protein
MAIAAATPVHLAPSITSVINTVPTPESWARGSMVIGPTPAIVDPPVEEVRAHDAAVLLGGDQVEAVVGEQIGEKPCRGFAQGKSGGSWCRCNGPERLEANPPCLLGIVCPASPGPSRPAVHVESRVAGNQEEVPFARSLGGPPNLKASVMIMGTGTMIRTERARSLLVSS